MYPYQHLRASILPQIARLLNRQHGELVTTQVYQAKRHYSTPLTDPENKGAHSRGTNFDTLGAWDNRLQLPILLDQSIKKGKPIPKIGLEHVGYASAQGRRDYQEDMVKIAELRPDLLYFGVFDGHGGPLAADYVSEFLEDHINFWLKKEDDLRDVLRNSFIDVNNSFSRHLHFRNLDKQRPDFSGGTTATVCLLKNSLEMAVCHVGDSRAILCREGKAQRLTIDHEPELEGEKDRIVDAGGHITFNSLGSASVNGRLAMTRSIGDVELKKSGVTAEPFVKGLEIKHGSDAFLLLTTDGITYVMSDQELVNIISTCSDPKEAANLITDQALQFGTEDNASAVVVPFGAWGKYASTAYSVPYSFGRNILGKRYH